MAQDFKKFFELLYAKDKIKALRQEKTLLKQTIKKDP